ncbi:MAG: hypothetical protein ACJA13_004132 [Paraglaciecola sp.]|jgi:hypothetical protein
MCNQISQQIASSDYVEIGNISDDSAETPDYPMIMTSADLEIISLWIRNSAKNPYAFTPMAVKRGIEILQSKLRLS